MKLINVTIRNTHIPCKDCHKEIGVVSKESAWYVKKRGNYHLGRCHGDYYCLNCGDHKFVEDKEDKLSWIILRSEL